MINATAEATLPAQTKMTLAAEVSPEPETITRMILVLRGQRVLLDADLARISGVPTSRLNEQVKRIAQRFPDDLVFRLTREEARQVSALRSQNAGLEKGLHLKHLPLAFTGHGAIQAANVLTSAAAIEMGIHVVRAFTSLRQRLTVNLSHAARDRTRDLLHQNTCRASKDGDRGLCRLADCRLDHDGLNGAGLDTRDEGLAALDSLRLPA
jgi:hypothetical protein